METTRCKLRCVALDNMWTQIRHNTSSALIYTQLLLSHDMDGPWPSYGKSLLKWTSVPNISTYMNTFSIYSLEGESKSFQEYNSLRLVKTCRGRKKINDIFCHKENVLNKNEVGKFIWWQLFHFAFSLRWLFNVIECNTRIKKKCKCNARDST